MKKMFGIEHIKPISLVSRKQEINLLPNEISKLKEHVDNCSLCELYKSKISSGFGKGDASSSVYIVGLDYSFDSEKEYTMIKNMCEKVLDININDIYMTNIIKCSTNKKTNDIENEINQCIYYIEQQITLGKPKNIITLGDSFKYLMKNNDDIIDISGNSFYYNGIQLLPLMDPVFISKNPSYKEKMFVDLKKIKTIMDEQ